RRDAAPHPDAGGLRARHARRRVPPRQRPLHVRLRLGHRDDAAIDPLVPERLYRDLRAAPRDELGRDLRLLAGRRVATTRGAGARGRLASVAMIRSRSALLLGPVAALAITCSAPRAEAAPPD